MTLAGVLRVHRTRRAALRDRHVVLRMVVRTDDRRDVRTRRPSRHRARDSHRSPGRGTELVRNPRPVRRARWRGIGNGTRMGALMKIPSAAFVAVTLVFAALLAGCAAAAVGGLKPAPPRPSMRAG